MSGVGSRTRLLSCRHDQQQSAALGPVLCFFHLMVSEPEGPGLGSQAFVPPTPVPTEAPHLQAEAFSLSGSHIRARGWHVASGSTCKRKQVWPGPGPGPTHRRGQGHRTQNQAGAQDAGAVTFSTTLMGTWPGWCRGQPGGQEGLVSFQCRSNPHWPQTLESSGGPAPQVCLQHPGHLPPSCVEAP